MVVLTLKKGECIVCIVERHFRKVPFCAHVHLRALGLTMGFNYTHYTLIVDSAPKTRIRGV